MPAITIGILEDEEPQAQLLSGWLTAEGYHVFHAASGEAFLERLKEENPGMLILDWQLPDCEGIDILKEVREQLQFTGPVVFATAKDSEEDIVLGLTSGADDYIIKPLRRAELIARLAALWRRSGIDESEVLELGPVRLDLTDHIVTLDDEVIALTPTEFKLAACVLSNFGKLLSRDFLLREVWGVDAQLDTRTVDMHMSRLRKLLKIGPNMGYCIKTVYRHGYRLEAL